MIYLLDTNVWMNYLNPGETPVKSRLVSLLPDAIRLCSVVKAELLYGAYRSTRKQANLALLKRLFSRFESLAFDDQAAQQCGSIRSVLANQGTPIGPYDLMIAAIALVNNTILVTHNTSEFSRVAGWRLEDWEI